MTAAGVWIARIVFEPAVAKKLLEKHGVRWHTHPVYGRRLIVQGVTYRGDPILAYLKLIDERDGTWGCRTARRLSP